MLGRLRNTRSLTDLVPKCSKKTPGYQKVIILDSKMTSQSSKIDPRTTPRAEIIFRQDNITHTSDITRPTWHVAFHTLHFTLCTLHFLHLTQRGPAVYAKRLNNDLHPIGESAEDPWLLPSTLPPCRPAPNFLMLFWLSGSIESGLWVVPERVLVVSKSRQITLTREL